MILEFPTGREVKDDGRCDNCWYNCGNKKENGKIIDDIIWCDKYICNVFKRDSNCKYYKFKYEGDKT